MERSWTWLGTKRAAAWLVAIAIGVASSVGCGGTDAGGDDDEGEPSTTGSEALTGVRGHFDLLEYDYFPLYPDRSFFWVGGWAFNPYTAPSQEVRAVVADRQVSWVDTANLHRPDVQRVYHLAFDEVGFRYQFSIDRVQGWTKVCLQARDEGSSQAWLPIGSCRWVYVPPPTDPTSRM